MARPIHVAVVHDDPVFLRLAALILKDGGYEATLCRSDADVHGVIAAALPDIVMVDTWPDSRGQGWDLVQTLRLDPLTKSIPIILASSDPREILLRAEEFGAMKNLLVLGKPFVPEILLAAVARVTALTAGLDNEELAGLEFLPD